MSHNPTQNQDLEKINKINLERFLERKSEFKHALNRLADALAQPTNEYTRDASIQRFEFTYELAWKALKNYLLTKDIDVRNAKDTLAAALEQGLITNGEAWSGLHRQRNLTSHTYDLDLALTVYDYLKETGLNLFLQLAQTLEKLSIKP